MESDLIDNISKFRKGYIQNSGKLPNEIRINNNSVDEFKKRLVESGFIENVDIELCTFMGMNVIIDNNLPKDIVLICNQKQ